MAQPTGICFNQSGMAQIDCSSSNERTMLLNSQEDFLSPQESSLSPSIQEESHPLSKKDQQAVLYAIVQDILKDSPDNKKCFELELKESNVKQSIVLEAGYQTFLRELDPSKYPVVISAFELIDNQKKQFTNEIDWETIKKKRKIAITTLKNHFSDAGKDVTLTVEKISEKLRKNKDSSSDDRRVEEIISVEKTVIKHEGHFQTTFIDIGNHTNYHMSALKFSLDIPLSKEDSFKFVMNGISRTVKKGEKKREVRLLKKDESGVYFSEVSNELLTIRTSPSKMPDSYNATVTATVDLFAKEFLSKIHPAQIFDVPK